MRRKSVLPANSTPYMSNTSRSSQPATGHSVVTVGTGVVSLAVHLTMTRWFCVTLSSM